MTVGAKKKTGVTFLKVKRLMMVALELVKYDRLDVKLIYNDYNCYQNPENIIHLVD